MAVSTKRKYNKNTGCSMYTCACKKIHKCQEKEDPDIETTEYWELRGKMSL